MLPNAIAPVFDRPLLGLHRGTVALSGMLGLLFSLPVAAEVRQGTLRVRGAGWVEAATAMGLSRARVFLGHVLPEVLGVVRRNLFRIFPGILVAEALMAFLAVGARKPPASLGALIRSGSSVMAVYPWLLYVPALFLVGVCVCSFVLARGEPEFEAEETP
jgi:oligopeptide transport system permease protein